MYTIQNFKSDTLASQMLAAATSGTLSSGNFTNDATAVLILDYDSVTKREIITCTITGTALTSVTRGLGGTSAVDHSAGAKVIMAFTSLHYGDLGKLAASDAWTTFTVNATGYASKTSDFMRYMQVGKFVYCYLEINGVSNTTALTFTLPVAAKITSSWGPHRINDNSTLAYTGLLTTTASSTTASCATSSGGAGWTAANNKAFITYFFYEAA